MNKIFLDTNIIIDFIDTSRKNHLKAKKLIVKLIEKEYEIFISEDMISTVYYVLKGIPELLIFFEKVLEEWNIVAFGKKTIIESIEYCKKNNADLEDAMQCFCAKNYGCKWLITNDKKFVNCGIEIMDYDSFLKEKNA